MKIPELKVLCRARGLTVGGNKKDLITRLSTNSAVTISAVTYLPTESAIGRAKNFLSALYSTLNNQNVEETLLGFPCFHLYESEEDLPTTEQLSQNVRSSDIR